MSEQTIQTLANGELEMPSHNFVFLPLAFLFPVRHGQLKELHTVSEKIDTTAQVLHITLSPSLLGEK